MTWFPHRCHFCGHKSRDVVFIVGDSDYQCTDHELCTARREQKLADKLAGITIGIPLNTKTAKRLGLWTP